MRKIKVARFIVIVIVAIIGNIIIYNISGKLIDDYFSQDSMVSGGDGSLIIKNPVFFAANKSYSSIFDVLNIKYIGQLNFAYILIDSLLFINSFLLIKLVNIFNKSKFDKLQEQKKRKQIIKKRGVLSKIKVCFIFTKNIFLYLLIIDILRVLIKSTAISFLYFTENMYELGMIHGLSINLELIRIFSLLVLFIVVPTKMHLHMKSNAIKRWNKTIPNKV